MSLPNNKNIFIIGGTGAQGLPIIKSLVSDRNYSVRVLTRDPSSARAKSLLSLGNVELYEGTLADEAILHSGFSGCDGAFINIDGFNTGEKTEIYWAIRAYEIALQEGIKFFVYGNLDYVSKKSGYDPRFRAGHFDGKGRIGEWILFQNDANKEKMGAALFTTGPYIDMAIASQTIITPEIVDGVVTWRLPLGDGSMLAVALEDCGVYVRWLFDNRERSNGMNLEVAIEDVKFDEFAKAFEKVTGLPAKYVDISLEEFWKEREAFAALPAGYNADPTDKSTMNIKDNFTGFVGV
jgi:hypothetical protein